MPTQDQVYNPSQSILETYINARKDQLDRQRQAQVDATSKANIDSEIEARKQLHDESMKRLDEEHKINLSNIELQQAQIQAAHLAAKEHIRKSILEGTTPIPAPLVPQVNNQAPVSSEPNPLSSFQASIPAQNAPLTSEGVTLQGNEYNTPAQAVEQAAPIQQNKLEQAGKLAYVESKGKTQGAEEVQNAPGGLYEQQAKLEQSKLDNALKVADITSLRAQNVATISAESRKEAARISGNARITAAGISRDKNQLSPEEIEDRANQLQYGEGTAMGHSPTDLRAASVLSRSGRSVVTPKVVDNIKSMKPLEEFSTQLTDFANTYLPDNKLGALVNAAKLNSPISSDEKNAYNQLLLQSTNIAKGIEGATGRILMAQVNTAKDFIANKNITKKQLVDNAQLLNKLVLTATEGQLGNLSPSQRVDFLDHWGMQTLAAHEAKRWQLGNATSNAPVQKEKVNYLNHPDYEVVK